MADETAAAGREVGAQCVACFEPSPSSLDWTVKRPQALDTHPERAPDILSLVPYLCQPVFVRCCVLLDLYFYHLVHLDCSSVRGTQLTHSKPPPRDQVYHNACAEAYARDRAMFVFLGSACGSQVQALIFRLPLLLIPKRLGNQILPLGTSIKMEKTEARGAKTTKTNKGCK
ncbi:hypothetical protein Cgig2_030260 [Carnegiea gigantea]|uniref:Uncharacterized protein n=1 Tax=Carnegiea gigantea TaxID=171969 RepID=A0A9Q1K0U1_9CARY|nr:hypothetical protein Cgig2_030260 [Carnegiea gigantea]